MNLRKLEAEDVGGVDESFAGLSRNMESTSRCADILGSSSNSLLLSLLIRRAVVWPSASVLALVDDDTGKRACALGGRRSEDDPEDAGGRFAVSSEEVGIEEVKPGGVGCVWMGKDVEGTVV
jgi:hypothetical protein